MADEAGITEIALQEEIPESKIPVSPDRDARLSGSRRDKSQRADDPRRESERDRDRITYAASFRRLSGVTQIITPPGYAPALHTRLTHSLKVAQIARSIANVLAVDSRHDEIIKKFGGLDPVTCEAAALAHDLGHPPFGHIGEQVLDEEARNLLGLRDGFEGNAQTIRVVTLGYQRSSKSEGLDLTLGTLAAIAKYPWVRSDPCPLKREDSVSICHVSDCPEGEVCSRARRWNKFNFYDDQQDILEEIRRISKVAPEIQSLEASVMDLADDIAYAVHDLEDFFLSGYISSQQVIDDLTLAFANLVNAAETSEDSAETPKQFAENLDRIHVQSQRSPEWIATPFDTLAEELAMKYPYFDQGIFDEQIAEVFTDLSDFFATHLNSLTPGKNSGRIGDLTSQWIGQFLAPSSFAVKAEPIWDHGPHISLEPEPWHKVQIFKFITKNYIIQQSDIALLQVGQKRVMKQLVEMLLQWAKDDPKRLPPKLQERMQEAADYGDMDALEEIHIEHGLLRAQRRCLIDYICSLTDSQAVALHARLSGQQIHSAGVAEVF